MCGVLDELVFARGAFAQRQNECARWNDEMRKLYP